MKDIYNRKSIEYGRIFNIKCTLENVLHMFTIDARAL